MNGVTRSVGFRKHDGHLASTAAHTCGFVPMQGTGAQPETFFNVPAPRGGHITLRFEDSAPEGPPLPDGILASDPAQAWSGLTIADMTPWCDIYLWLAGLQPGSCRLDQAGDPQLAGGGPVMKTGWYPFAIARDGTLSYLTVRDLPDGSGTQSGALAYGHHADDAAATLISHLHAWDARGRNLPPDAFTYWPNETTPPLPDGLISVFRKRHGTTTITWPAERPAETPAEEPRHVVAGDGVTGARSRSGNGEGGDDGGQGSDRERARLPPGPGRRVANGARAAPEAGVLAAGRGSRRGWRDPC